MICGFFVCLFMGFIIPVKLDKYDLIVIPISKRPVIINNLIQIPIARTKERNNLNKPNKFIRIDIENYDEPTETPDLDSFDYMKERKDFWSSTNENRNDNLGDNDDRNIERNDQTYERYDRSRNEDDENHYGNSKRADEDGAEDQHTADFYDTEINYADDKIVGGREVDINLYPYHVAYGTNCGGAIIDKNWVITAGHCGKKPYIRLGSKYLNQGTKINIKRSIIHPNWSAKNKEHPFDYDFQLLETTETIKFNENTQPIKLAHIEDMVIGKIITVTGWGNTEENGPYSSVLRAVRVPIISKENCQNVPFPYFRGSLTARMFCAGFDEGKKDACQRPWSRGDWMYSELPPRIDGRIHDYPQFVFRNRIELPVDCTHHSAGDSGGPAVAYDRLLGMVSFGYGCATPGSYGVYAKVAKIRPWIEQITGLKLD